MVNILFVKLGSIGLGLIQWTTGQSMSCTVYSTSVVCENVYSSFFTNIRSDNIEVIKIVNSSLTSLSEEDFSKFTNVSEITVDKCSVPRRVLKFMLSLTELEQLRITNSNLSEKDIPVLRDARNLIKLSFEGNKLTRVKNEIFNSLFHLQEIDLSFNEISEIDTTAFDDLPALRKLDLSHNRIFGGLGVIIQKGFSNSFSPVEVIDLSHNEISQIEADAFDRLPTLRLLDMAYNRLGESDSLITRGMFHNLSYLEEINLSHNAIFGIESGALDGLPSLRVLDLSYNELGEGGGIKTGVFAGLPHVEEIDLSHNAISEVESGALDGLPSLRLLDLSHNALGRGFSRGVLTLPRGCAWCADAGACPAAHACPPPAAVDTLWRALARTRALRLRGNPVCQAVDSAPAPQEQCADEVLQGEEGCRERQAGGCAQHACRDAFLQAACEEHGLCETSQTSVACEGLSGNFIPAGNTVHVHVMYIIESDMSSLSARDFDAFQNLQVMHIDSCILSVSAGSIFAPLKRLRTLEIIGSNVSEEVFSLVESANSLVKLSLEGNRLTHVNKSFFDNLSRVEELDLSRNEISTIEVDAFRGLSALRRLDLSQNQLPDDFDMSSLSLPGGCVPRSLVATCPGSAADDSRRGRRRGGLDEGGRRREDDGRRGGEWDGGAGTEGEQSPRSNASGDDGSTGQQAPVKGEKEQNVLKPIAALVVVLLVVLLLLLLRRKFKPQLFQSSLHGSMDNDGGEGGSLNEHGDGPLGRTGWRPEDWEESSQQTLLPRDALNPHLEATWPSGAVSGGLHRGRFLAGFRRRTKHGPSSSLKRAKKNYLEKQILSQEQLINDVERRLTRHITDLKDMIMAIKGGDTSGKDGGGDGKDGQTKENAEERKEDSPLQTQLHNSQNDSPEAGALIVEKLKNVDRQIESELTSLKDGEKAQKDGDNGNSKGGSDCRKQQLDADNKQPLKPLSVSRSIQEPEKRQDTILSAIRALERRVASMSRRMATADDCSTGSGSCSDSDSGSKRSSKYSRKWKAKSRTDRPKVLKDDFKQLSQPTTARSLRISRLGSQGTTSAHEMIKKLEDSFAEERKNQLELERAFSKTQESKRIRHT